MTNDNDRKTTSDRERAPEPEADEVTPEREGVNSWAGGKFDAASGDLHDEGDEEAPNEEETR